MWDKWCSLFKNSECKVRCNIHNRRFDPIITIDLNDNKDSYKSNVYDFKINQGNIFISLRNDLNNRKNLDWSK